MPSVNVLCSQLHTRRTHVHLDTTRAGMREISFGGSLYISIDHVCGRNIFVLLCMTCSLMFPLFSGHFPIKCAFMRSVYPFPYIQTSYKFTYTLIPHGNTSANIYTNINKPNYILENREARPTGELKNNQALHPLDVRLLGYK